MNQALKIGKRSKGKNWEFLFPKIRASNQVKGFGKTNVWNKQGRITFRGTI